MSIFHWIAFAISALIFAASVFTVLHHVAFGLAKTNLNDRYVWGLNIQGFFVLSSVAGGILAVISAFIIFGVEYPVEVFELAAAVAFSCLLSAMMLMGADLGRPFRVYKIITGRNLSSPLTIDFLCVASLAALSFIFMFGIFMNIYELLRLWAYASLFFVVVCLLAHVMMFMLTSRSAHRVKSFDALVTVSSSIWAGTAAVSILALSTEYRGILLSSLLVITIIVFAIQVGCIVGSSFAGQKPHNLIFIGMSFIVLIFLAGRGIIINDLWIAEAAICVLVIAAVTFEKFEMVMSFQKGSALPLPYSMYDRVKPYRPSFSEVGNMIAGVSFVVAATYAVIIVRTYILPFIIRLLNS